MGGLQNIMKQLQSGAGGLGNMFGGGEGGGPAGRGAPSGGGRR